MFLASDVQHLTSVLGMKKSNHLRGSLSGFIAALTRKAAEPKGVIGESGILENFRRAEKQYNPNNCTTIITKGHLLVHLP